MTRFDDLLTVQEHDSAIDRLRTQRERLPERDQITERGAEAAELEARLAEVRAEYDDVLRDEKRLDDSVTSLQQRYSQVEADLYSGTTSSPKELQAMQAELEQLRRQQSTFEDQELDAMERREGLDGEIAQLEQKLASARDGVEELRRSLEAQEHEIDEQVEREREGRVEAAAAIESSLLELYEKVRAANRGVGVARLVSGTCQGCHLALPAVEVDRIKKLPADELVRCEQCGSILVR